MSLHVIGGSRTAVDCPVKAQHKSMVLPLCSQFSIDTDMYGDLPSAHEIAAAQESYATRMLMRCGIKTTACFLANSDFDVGRKRFYAAHPNVPPGLFDCFELSHALDHGGKEAGDLYLNALEAILTGAGARIIAPGPLAEPTRLWAETLKFHASKKETRRLARLNGKNTCNDANVITGPWPPAQRPSMAKKSLEHEPERR